MNDLYIEAPHWEPLARECYRLQIADMLTLWVMYVVQHDGAQFWRWSVYTIKTHPGQGEVETEAIAKREALRFATGYLETALGLISHAIVDSAMDERSKG